MLTRRQFFAQMRKLGFSKSRLQMTRIGLTYDKVGEEGRVAVTVPKHHESTFTILGDVPYSGIFVEATTGKQINWGTQVCPSAHEHKLYVGYVRAALLQMSNFCPGLINFLSQG